MSELDKLVGKTVFSVFLSDHNDYIQFKTDKEIISFYSEGECCSESWINHISGIDTLIGQKVLRVEDVWMDKNQLFEGDEGFSGVQEVDTIYRYKIFTQSGICELEMRNASNGYYGGYLDSSSGYIVYRLNKVEEDF